MGYGGCVEGTEGVEGVDGTAPVRCTSEVPWGGCGCEEIVCP